MDRKAIGLIATVIVLGATLVSRMPGCTAATAHIDGQVAVYFSPHGGCTDAVVAELDQAKRSVYVQAYSFTSTNIAEALVDAHRRGVKVEVIVDKKESRDEHCVAASLARAGIRVLTDGVHAIAHNKVMILDEQTVITGSFNFTKAAEHSNAENMLILPGKELAATYLANWHQHEGHSEPFDERDRREGSSTDGLSSRPHSARQR